jgi:23S rRNA pseudouridine1911/1915/1917 synthase
VTPESFAVDLPLRRAQGSVIELKMETAPESQGGQPALTEFRRLSVHENAHGSFSLVECLPRTGRQHQIRVHLESAGHPILGDKLYGMPVEEALSYYERKHLSAEAQARLLIPRHALHAAGIAFTHPLTEREMEFRSPLPADLQRFLERGTG